MATHFKFDCPHCLTRGAGFRVFHEWPVRGNSTQANLLAVCGPCNGGLLVWSQYIHGSGHPSLVQNQVDFPGNSYVIVRSWPTFSSAAPADVPDNLTNFYLQATENLHHERWDAAGAMFRKTLDVATKTLRPDLASKKLYSRIETMVADGDLTAAMGQWSHRIRMDGNDALHDEEPETEGDARAAQRFTEAFLTYSYTLPALVQHGQPEPSSTEAAE